MKRFLIVAVLAVFANSFSQDMWKTSIELDFGFPSDWEYEYQSAPHKFTYVDLEDSGFLLNSFGSGIPRILYNKYPKQLVLWVDLIINPYTNFPCCD